MIAREDLPRGVLAAQIVHAAGESSPGNLPGNTFAVVLTAKNEAHLLELEKELQAKDIAHHAIREPDRANELMCIGLVPILDRSIVGSVTKKLRLLK